MRTVELAVIGAGPAGLSAAIQAGELGVETLVLDENAGPGGQIYRQLPADFQIDGPERLGSTFAKGAKLLARVERAVVTIRSNTVVWSLDRDLNLEVASPMGSEIIRAQRVILAAGAYDRPVPVPGWTLPGVFTMGGAQNLLKSQGLLVGKRILVAGTGPLLLLVASQLAKAGAEIIVADPVPRHAALRQLPALWSERPLLLDGARYHWNLLRRRARWLSPSVISSIDGAERVEIATVVGADESWRPVRGTERTFEVDAVALGYGLLPSTELARLTGCRFHYDETSSTWLPEIDEDFSTTIPGLAVVGDGARISGAVAAAEQGRIAAVAVARDLRRIEKDAAQDLQAPSRQRLRSLDRFRDGMDHVYAPRAGLQDLTTPATVVCRCEEVTAAEIDEAISCGITDLAPLKAATRVTMGPCQGRMCLPALLARVARATDRHPSTVEETRPRAPSKPVPLSWFSESRDPIAG